MEVDKAKYPQQLLTILKQIANAKFVTFDLEMSGIMAGQYKFGRTKPLRSANKPSLQEQYLETKEAADMYQVLQVGITIVEEDRERGMYVARPYNFNLSPLFLHGDRLDVDRKFTFSSSACDFLVKNGFNFGAVFEKGVPYLSREEEVQSRARIAKRLGPQEREDIIIAPNEHETLEFFRKARKTIKDWINDKSKSRQDFVNIGSSEGPLNGYQRRLIHQLVTNEFPEHRTFARNEKSFMQIEKIDHQKEAEFQRKKLVDFDGMIAKQTGKSPLERANFTAEYFTGLRWIFEALCGGDLSGVDPWWFCYGPDSKSKNDMKNEMEGELRKVAMALKVKKTVLVGHNMFTDLMFLYKTFVGPLPRHSRDFQKRIHALFPVVIDTKYLATYKADDMNPREGLKQLWEPYKNVHMPFVVLEEQHMAYGASYGKDHEAGFDSWMTADLFIKISAKLYSEGRTTAPPPESYLALQPAPAFESSTSGGEDLTTDDAASDVSSDWSEEWFEEDHLPGSLPGGGVALPKNPPNTNGKASMADNLPPMWHAMQLNPASDTELNRTSSNGHGAGTGVIQQWLPAVENKFWDAFVNILRVNSIEGGVCRLSLICEDDF